MRRTALAAVLAWGGAAAPLFGAGTRPALPVLDRTPADYAWSQRELAALGGRVGRRLEVSAARVDRGGVWRGLAPAFFAAEVDYAAAPDAGGTRLLLPDRELFVAEKDLDAYLSVIEPRAFLKELGFSDEALRGAGERPLREMARRLGVYDLARTALARGLNPPSFEEAGRLLRGPLSFRIPDLFDPAQAAAAAWPLAADYARLELERRSSAPTEKRGPPREAILRRGRELWRAAIRRSDSREPWVPGGAMEDAIEARAGAPPPEESSPRAWEAILALLERPSEGESLALSPDACDALALALTAGGRENPARSEERAREPWFAAVPSSHSGLTRPAPEAPLRNADAPGEMPGGLAVLDFDGDGRDDLFFCGTEQARLYRNLGGFRFKDATAPAGLAGLACNGASSADFDNDGRPDLFTGHDRAKRDRLWRNAGGRFVDATLALGLSTAPAETTSAVWFDYDRDGRLDLFLAGAQDYRREMKAAFEFTDGLADRLYRNLGNRFEERAEAAGVAGKGWALAAAAFDFDGDGRPDLDVQDDFGRNRLFRNRGDGTFEDASGPSGADARGNGMGVSVGDFDRDGRPDLWLTYIGDQRTGARFLPPKGRAFRLGYEGYVNEGQVRVRQRNRLLRNLGGGRFEDAFDDAVESVPTGWGWNGYFLDAANRGWPDVFQTAGWWPHRLGFSRERQVFWRYDPAQSRFRDASRESGLDFRGSSRSGVAADLNGDGCLDVVTTGFDPIRLFEGRCPKGNHWLGVKLQGRRSNRDGIGARVTVRTAALSQTEELGPQGGGFQNSPPRRLHFGLGTAARADAVEVRWPGGTIQKLGPVEADRVILVKEDAGLDR